MPLSINIGALQRIRKARRNRAQFFNYRSNATEGAHLWLVQSLMKIVKGVQAGTLTAKKQKHKSNREVCQVAYR